MQSQRLGCGLGRAIYIYIYTEGICYTCCQFFCPALHTIVALFSQLFIEERVEVHNLWKRDVAPGTLADHCIVKIYNLGSRTMSLNIPKK